MCSFIIQLLIEGLASGGCPPLARKINQGDGGRGGGATQSGKGYRLWSDHCGAVAVTTNNGFKKRGAVLLSYCRIGELSQSFQLIFHAK